MSSPFSYTHPSHIAQGYRAGAREEEYVRKYPVHGQEEDYPLYHRDHCKLPRSNSNCCACLDELPEETRRPEPRREPLHPPTRRTQDMVAAYGVYSQHAAGVEETGFEYPPQVVVVTSQRDGSTAHSLAAPVAAPHARPLRASPAPRSSCCPAVPFVLAALLLIIFLLVSGVLFYFNIMTYTPDSTLQDVCEGVQCAHGGICMVDAAGETVCRCPVDCPAVVAPLCGTDGNTYTNMCALRLYSCANKKTVLVQHSGECESRDPCSAGSCPVGARCVPSPDGLSASCLCPKHCPLYSSHLALSPICGTDNRDYRDQCDMHRQACEHNRSVSVKYEGHCDPCGGHECPVPEVCQLDEDRHAVCRCAEVCPEDLSPVCGSDGLTYSNECYMRQAACHFKKTIRIIYRGTCSSGVNPCDGVECVYGEECRISKFGIAQCECVSQCEPVVREVCGSDGRTYDSHCHLHKAACLDRTAVSVLYNGPCDSSRSCRDVVCEHGGQCEVRRGVPACQCPHCPLHYSPLCGSDGHSYRNECELRAVNCHHMKNVEAVHQGVCNGCDTKTCGYFSTCESDKQGVAQCVCVKNCPKEETASPVCGSDGTTYESICELRKFVCESKLPVELDYEGDCELCAGVQCKFGARCRAGVCVCPSQCPQGQEEPVCASNMETYSNECEMQRQGCASDPPQMLTVIFFGACSIKFKIGRTHPTIAGKTSAGVSPCQDIQCEHGASCELGADSFPRCSCLLDCSQEDVVHICGSDFRIYNSTCAMRMEACQRQKEIRLRPLDLCKGMEVKPCNGGGAVVDPETGEEMDCGSGPRRQDCPLNSYCHQTPNFAKCCPKEAGVYLKSCQDSWYGCCPDKKTPAQGPEHLGCPSLCGCNKIGSYSEACVGDSEQCLCKPGVGGLRCDRCQPGYWGLPKITSGYQGCLSCGCSTLGSVREDCEQMTGRCVCKPGVQGHKCDSCVDPQHSLTASGCVSGMETTASSKCEDISCDYGAACVSTPDGPHCLCSLSCPDDDLQEMVCGDDGKLYASKCQLKLFVCQIQKQIGIQDMKYCSDDSMSMTDVPIKQWTLDHPFTEPEEVNFPLSKSTRHILVSQPKRMPNRIAPGVHHVINIDRNNADLSYGCDLNPCNNGGTCLVSAVTGMPTCLCPTNYRGTFCTERLVPKNELYDNL